MRWTSSLPRWLAAVTAGLLSVSLVAALVTSNRPADPPKPDAPLVKAREITPLFAKTEPAANPSALVLMPHESGVRGWVAGNKSYAGFRLTIKGGKEEFEAPVGDDNTFTWAHTSAKPLPLTFKVGAADPLTARTTLPARADKPKRTAFVVTDRSAYRPGHTLKFVAYVHDSANGIDYKPVANTDFTVDLVSEQRRTRATRLKLRSDDAGRVVGQYTFTDADELDHYALHLTERSARPDDSGNSASIPGGARVLLGEYRKTKVGVKLKGEVKDGKLVVTFDARDYLGREVKGTSATWSATVTKQADATKLTLDPTKFVADEGGPPSADEFDALPDEERLLTLANGVSAMSFAGFGGRTVATREGKATFVAADAPKVALDLWPEWLKGEHTVAVSGVFLDETGRENRASGTFSLTPVKEKNVLVGTAKELYATGETITANLTPIGVGEKDAAATTVVVVKLEASPSSPWVTPQIGDDGDGGVPDNTRIPPLGTKLAAKATDAWKAVPVFDPVKRKVLTVVPAANNKATLDLKQAGAYKLLAITRLADGTTFQSETGVVVKAPAKLPGVALQLDARELPAGGRLAGTVHTRFSGAKMLLTLRDAGGVQLVKPLVAGANGVVRFDEPLPANLRYGCAVCVQYPESAAVVHADQRDVFVTPTDRTLAVTATAPETVGPGAEVKLGLQVNREEEVDLIVSVFDESLLGVSGDLSKNIRDFYLADARGQGRAARDLTATRLGGVAIAELVAKAEKLLKDKDATVREPGLEQRLQVLVENWKLGKLNADNAVTLVRLAGFEVYLGHTMFHPSDNGIRWNVPKSARLSDLLRRDGSGEDDGSKFYLSATVIDNVVLVAIGARGGMDPWLMHRGNTYTGYPCYGFGCGGWQFCGGFGCNGWQFNGFNGQFGNLGQQFGISGWGHGFGGGNFLGGQFGGIGGGFGGGGFGGVPGVAGFQGSHSYQSGNGLFSQPFVGGQMGFSAGFNRDFLPSAPGAIPTGGTLPGLGVGQDVVRRDFADSAFWSTTIRTDKSGKATAAFKVPDSLTNWRVQVTAISPKLHVGTASARFKTSRPVMIWPMLPRAFTEGDVVQVFGTVHNLSEKEQTIRVHLTAENGAVMSAPEQTVKVPANGSVPVYWTYRAGKAGMTDLLMSAKCDAGSDASLKKLPVTAAAVVERVTASGLVGGGNLKVTLPDGFDPKTAQVTVTVAPTLAADLADTLPYLVEYPYGCVEQTMSRFLPAIRVAAILKQAGISTNAKLEEKLPKVVEAGQKRLISLQQPDGGWGWNGDSQTHEMMTPYALFGLLAAEEAGYPCPNADTISRGMARLKQYLANGQRWDVNEGRPAAPGERVRQAAEVNDALFMLWVAGLNADRAKAAGIDMEFYFGRIEKAAGRADISDSGHAFALELAVKYGKKELAAKLVTELHKRAQKGGDRVFWTKAGFSRWGDNTTEVTATVMKALVANDPKDSLIPGVLAYFHSTKRGDRWDSTKDTAHVLYALCDYLVAVQAGPAAAGIVKVAMNGAGVGEVKLDSPASKSVKFAGKDLKPGDNTFAATGAEAAGGALVRVSVAFTRNDGKLTQARDHGVKVVRTVSVRDAGGKWSELKSGASVPTGSYVKVTVTATPATGDLRYFLIESPKPAGFETVAADDTRFGALAGGHVLREDREAMTCFHYEQIGAATAEFVMMAEFEGECTLAAARGELMYQPASGGHSDAFVLKVTAKK